MAVSDKPWRFSPADYSIEQWRRACLVDRGSGDPDSKSRYALPVREPSGALNRNGVHAAAGGHGVNAVSGITDEQRRAAARKLVGLYRELGEDPPDSLLGTAGMRSAQEVAAMGQEMYRSFNPDLSVRSGGDGRTIYGIAVPWRAPVRIDSALVEQWAPGAFDHQAAKPNRIRAAREHVQLGGTLIGALTHMRNDALGQYIELRVSRTPVGEETLELVRDGALDQLSIGFRERQNRRLAGGVVERVTADMFEVAIVMAGAYGDLATAAGVRSARPLDGPDIDPDVEMRMRAEKYLASGGLPTPPDHELELRAIRLGTF